MDTTKMLDSLKKWTANTYDQILEITGTESCFAMGDTNHWNMQSTTNAMASLAVYGKMTGDTKAIDTALSLARFTLHAHNANGGKTNDGQSWGNQWISALCVERMMHGIEVLQKLGVMTDNDNTMLKNMLISEATWLLNEYEIVAGPVENNKPESNIWNGCIMHKAATMYPDHPDAEKFLKKADEFLVNGISIPEDATSDFEYNGRKVKDMHVGYNMYSSYACNHHGYLNVGYMVICLSNIAMHHFYCKNNNLPVPETLYHHAAELWQLVKTCTFKDGRLCRIGGDTRARYCYCQDYLVPALVWVSDYLGDSDANTMLNGWLEQTTYEQSLNNDGTYLGSRLEIMRNMGPSYFLRLEQDRAVTMSMALYWQEYLKDGGNKVETLSCWEDEYHGAVITVGKKRRASWVKGAAGNPVGMVIPAEASDMAEWGENLIGHIKGNGYTNEWKNISTTKNLVGTDAFTAFTSMDLHSSEACEEGGANLIDNLVEQKVAMIALPEEGPVVILQKAVVKERTYINTVRALSLRIPNDIFNTERTYSGVGTKKVAVDGMEVDLIYGDDSLTLYKEPERRAKLKEYANFPHRSRAGGTLALDEICCCMHNSKSFLVQKGDLLFDICAAINVNPDKSIVDTKVNTTADGAEIILSLKDGSSYSVSVNWSDATCGFTEI